MKVLRIKQKDFVFIINIKEVLHIINKNEINEDLEEIQIFSLSKLLKIKNTDNEKEVVFIVKNKQICGIMVERVLDVVEISDVNTLENDIFMVEFIRGIVHINKEIAYLIDSEKMLEVAYE